MASNAPALTTSRRESIVASSSVTGAPPSSLRRGGRGGRCPSRLAAVGRLPRSRSRRRIVAGIIPRPRGLSMMSCEMLNQHIQSRRGSEPGTSGSRTLRLTKCRSVPYRLRTQPPMRVIGSMRTDRGKDFSMPETEVLRVEGLRVYYHTPAGPVKAVDGVSFASAAGRAIWSGRRVGQRQVDHCPQPAAPDQAARPDRRRDDRARRRRSAGARRRGDAPHPAGQDLPRRAGSDELPQSGQADQGADRAWACATTARPARSAPSISF